MSGGEQDGQQVDLAAAQQNVRAELLVVDHCRPHRKPASETAPGRGLVGAGVRGEFGQPVADLLGALGGRGFGGAHRLLPVVAVLGAQVLRPGQYGVVDGIAVAMPAAACEVALSDGVGVAEMQGHRGGPLGYLNADGLVHLVLLGDGSNGQESVRRSRREKGITARDRSSRYSMATFRGPLPAHWVRTRQRRGGLYRPERRSPGSA